MLILLLSDSVAARLRESTFSKARTVHLIVTDSSLVHYSKQGKMLLPSRSATDIADCAYELFRAVFPWNYPVRAVSVSVSDFIGPIEQMNLFTDILSEQKAERLENTIDRPAQTLRQQRDPARRHFKGRAAEKNGYQRRTRHTPRKFLRKDVKEAYVLCGTYAF